MNDAIGDSRAHDAILSALDIRAEPFAVCALEGVCSLGVDRAPGATLHYVLGGRGRISLQGMTPVDLAPGRLVLVPSCVRHSLHNDGHGAPGLPACRPAGLDLEEHVARGAGAGRMVVLCSRVSLALRDTCGLIGLLRAPLVADVAESPTTGQAMAALIHEMTRPRPGRQAMIRVLVLQCVLEMLRARLEARDPEVMWLAALADPGLLAALRAMLDDPGAPHALGSLAARAGMSRSRFAERFRAAYGRGPMGFLRALRLARAARMLAGGRAPVERVAAKVGFASRSAFSRAFAEAWGQPPGRFRRQRG